MLGCEGIFNGENIDEYLVGFGSVTDMQMLENDYFVEFTVAGMGGILKRTYIDIPSKGERDRICEELSVVLSKPPN